MRSDQETVLQNAINALRAEPEAEQLQASARRVAGRLGLSTAMHSLVNVVENPIENCEDVQRALVAYRADGLANPRYLLIQAHLRECGVCHRYYNASTEAASVDWSTPGVTRAFNWSPRAFAWALAPTLALLAIFFFVYRAFWQVPPGVRAEVRSIDGSAYRISDAGDRQLAAGDKLLEGDRVRTGSGGHAVLQLADGSTVEVNERSLLGLGARGKNTTIALDNGAVIVQATHRTAGHLYVETPDCRVAVVGTVFSVNSGIKGSRVAVLEGSLHVTHAGTDTLMHAGEQVTTSENLSPEPVNEQIAWSHDRDKYLLLLAQFDTLQRRLDQIASPDLRYSSDLLQRVPADSLLYVSIPNLGEFLSEADTIFNDQLQKSPALQQWWNGGGKGDKTEDLNTLVNRLHQVSQYLGDEIVIVGLKHEKNPDFAIIADVKQGGLISFLRSQPPISASSPRLTVFNETSLAAASALPEEQSGGYALVREHEAVFSSSIAALKQINAQLNAGNSGFANSDFGKQIAAAYSRGAGMILAADLHQMLPSPSSHENEKSQEAMENSGIQDVRYLIAEHREKNGLPENHLDVQFAGARRGVASWLAAPAPIGSLDFVTPNASIAVAALSKDPAAIADDLMHMAVGDGTSAQDKWTDAEEKLHIDLRNDLAANLGGDFLLSLDGPVLPTPAWKSVIEVHDADRLEKTIESLIDTVQKEQASEAGSKRGRRIGISSRLDGAQRFYIVQDLKSGATVAQYTFDDGYMILAQDHAVLLQAIRAHTSGNSLARSTAFRALLPTDENADYSAVAYQNLSPVLTPLLSNFSGNLADAVRQMAADARPTAICAWGKDSTIEAASNSHLLGFDLLALQAMIHPDPARAGNNQAGASVRE